jgi:hypothetical protein
LKISYLIQRYFFQRRVIGLLSSFLQPGRSFSKKIQEIYFNDHKSNCFVMSFKFSGLFYSNIFFFNFGSTDMNIYDEKIQIFFFLKIVLDPILSFESIFSSSKIKTEKEVA